MNRIEMRTSSNKTLSKRDDGVDVRSGWLATTTCFVAATFGTGDDFILNTAEVKCLVEFFKSKQPDVQSEETEIK